ncbi:MAG: hypothetical protein P4M05_07265 [Bradyrhizobium sp.]|nr:hypothetical protein [Bradyrhizobium sp.]
MQGSADRQTELISRRGQQAYTPCYLSSSASICITIGCNFGQVNGRYFPKLLVVEALVLVPQDIADPDNGGPWRIGVFGEVIRRQRFRSFRNDLHGAFDCAAVQVAALVLANERLRTIMATPSISSRI